MLLLALVLTSAFASYSHAQDTKKIAILAIDNESSTQRTIRGIKKSLRQYNIEVTYKEVILTGEQKSDAELIKTVSTFDPDLIMSIGSFATLSASRYFPNKPVIFATVINPISSGFVKSMERPGGNITGAALDIPPNIQFTYFKRVVGSLKRIGVIYSEETENIIEPAKIAAKQLGITLSAIKVESEKDVPKAIDSLCLNIDALWSIADQRVFTPRSTQYIVLQTLRHKIPLMGFSRAVVEAGGLFTLDYDFKDIGRQAGESAVKVLQGISPARIPVTTPGAGVIYFKYNEKTASLISLEIPDELLAIAKEVIK